MTALALVACGHAGAEPPAADPPVEHLVPSGLAAPAGWQSLPAIARATAGAAKGHGVAITGAEAWGDRARGCYATWLALRGEGATAKAVFDGLAAAGLTAHDATPPAVTDTVVEYAIARGDYKGRVRARIVAGNITALACFANRREPGACDAPCTKLLGGLP